MTPQPLANLHPLLLALALLFTTPFATGQRSGKGAAAPSPCADDLSRTSSPRTLAQYAEMQVGKLVLPRDVQHPQPRWAYSDWTDKCGLFGQGCPLNSASSVHPQAEYASSIQDPSTKAALQKFFRNAEIPVQAQTGHLSLTSEQPLSSVYYNCRAQASIRAMIKARREHRPVPKHLAAGSIIVKLIWHLDRTPSAASHRYGRMWSSRYTAQSELEWSPQLGTSVSRPFPADTPDPTQWRYIKFCAADDSKCNPKTDSSAVFLNEIYAIPFSQSTVSNQFGSNCYNDCVAELVGANIMVRRRPNADWTWVTVWWNGAHHKNRLPGYWNNYEIAVTQSVRSTSASSPMNILFNPYLEGFTGENGRVSNCRTCHSYAALAPSPYGDQKRIHAMGTDTNHGGIGPGRLPVPEDRYRSALNASSIDQVWSLGSVPPPQ